MRSLVLSTLAFLVAIPVVAQDLARPDLRDAFGRESWAHEIDEGAACKVVLRVVERRTPFVTGNPLGSVPDDLYLRVARTYGENRLCDRLEMASHVQMNAFEEQLPRFAPTPEDRIVGTMIYGEVRRGGMLMDAYKHIFVLEEAPGDMTGVYRGLGIMP